MWLPALPDYYFSKSGFLPYNLKKFEFKVKKAGKPNEMYRVKYFLMFISLNTNLHSLNNIIFFRNLLIRILLKILH